MPEVAVSGCRGDWANDQAGNLATFMRIHGSVAVGFPREVYIEGLRAYVGSLVCVRTRTRMLNV